jgi:hypothetical protein
VQVIFSEGGYTIEAQFEVSGKAGRRSTMLGSALREVTGQISAERR